MTSSAASLTDSARNVVLRRIWAHGARTELLESAEHLQPSPAGHVDVEQHDVRTMLGDRGDGAVDVLGLGHDLDGVATLVPQLLQLGADAGAEHGMVVDQHDT